MQSDGNIIFVGMKINERLQEHLDASKPSMKSFYETNNPEFLQIMNIDHDDYIGKVIKSGSSIEIFSNILLNVKSMLKMICPRFIFADNTFTILALNTMPSRTFY